MRKARSSVGTFLSVAVGSHEASRLQYQEKHRTSRFHVTEWVRQPALSTRWLCHPRHVEARSPGQGKGGQEARGPGKDQAPKMLTAPPTPPHWPGSAAGCRAQLRARKPGKQSSWVLRKRKRCTCTLHPINPLFSTTPQPTATDVTHTLPFCVPSHKPLFPTSYPSTSQRF